MPYATHRPTARVLDILQLLATAKDGCTLTEIATAISVPKSTIVPIIRTYDYFLTYFVTCPKHVVVRYL